MKHVIRWTGVLALALVAACNGSTDYSSSTPAELAPVPETTIDDVALGPLLLEDDAESALDDLPSIVFREQLAMTGLEVAYTTGLQRDWIDPLGIEANWLHMVDCTGVSLPTPLIVVVEEEVQQLSDDDDVIRYIDGRTVASSSRSSTAAVLQIAEDDFTGAIGTTGFNLRAIMGRYLWLGASLAERDYPFECTRL